VCSTEYGAGQPRKMDSPGPAQPPRQWRMRELLKFRATGTATGHTTPSATQVENARSPTIIP
jgi:hypothetical protein